MGWGVGGNGGKRKKTRWDIQNRGVRSAHKCAQVCCFHPRSSGFLLDLPPFRPHDGALHMAKKELVKLGCGSDSQSFKELKGHVVKAGAVSLDLDGRGACCGLCTCR